LRIIGIFWVLLVIGSKVLQVLVSVAAEAQGAGSVAKLVAARKSTNYTICGHSLFFSAGARLP